ncbi:MAG TPA: heavy metal-responsive transcriptional regulator [Nitrospirae bacterium]|nr:heavy metal-responsive transcriptional regulator [Nitrospirota bacterium]
MGRMFIGDVAKKLDLNPRTIRYYEKIGLLPKAIRTDSGYRIYSSDTIYRLEFILKAKGLGLKLEDIKEIIDIHNRGEVPCPCTTAFLNNKISEIDEKMDALSALKIKLTKLLKPARSKTTQGTICPIIEKV